MPERTHDTPRTALVPSLNAVTHGLSARTRVIPGVESEDEWQEFQSRLVAAAAPADDLELALVERMVDLLWRLRRVDRAERDAIEHALLRYTRHDDQEALGGFYGAANDASPLSATAHHLLPPDGLFDKILRYEAHLGRQFYQALHELEALQSARRGHYTPLARIDINGSSTR